MKFDDVINLALKSLSTNILRSILTSLGIIIGVSSVITMISIGSGARQEVTNLIDNLDLEDSFSKNELKVLLIEAWQWEAILKILYHLMMLML